MQFSTFALAAILAPLTLAAPAPLAEPNQLALPAGVTEQPAAAAATVGNAVVKNNCGFTVYLRSVDNTVGPLQTIKAGGSYSEQFHTSGNGGGISLKMDKTGDPTGSGSGNIEQFEYTLSGSTVYYDLSTINGNPFVAYHNAIVPSISTCHTITCNANENPCTASYYPGDPSNPTYACASSGNLVYNIC
ncbi:hypothetical protein MMC10_009451 [Thelotrema lepadinum]|nr:hypothetical protein [Thelotrema lepadinum]